MCREGNYNGTCFAFLVSKNGRNEKELFILFTILVPYDKLGSKQPRAFVRESAFRGLRITREFN